MYIIIGCTMFSNNWKKVIKRRKCWTLSRQQKLVSTCSVAKSASISPDKLLALWWLNKARDWRKERSRCGFMIQSDCMLAELCIRIELSTPKKAFCRPSIVLVRDALTWRLSNPYHKWINDTRAKPGRIMKFNVWKKSSWMNGKWKLCYLTQLNVGLN